MSIKVYTLVLFQGAMLSCSQQEEPHSKLAGNGAQERLVVIHGGFNSCASSDSSKGMDLASDLEEGSELKVMASNASVTNTFYYKLVAGKCKEATAAGKACHSTKTSWLTESLVDQFEGRGATNWFVSCQPFDTDTLIWASSVNPTVNKTGTREEMWSDLVSFSNDKQNIHISGHSYGGWTSMFSALKLGDKVNQLSTIDPISVKLCKPAGVAGGNKECKRFPSDINAEMQQNVMDTVKSWDHYWQTVDNGGFLKLGLHSGPSVAQGVLQEEMPFKHTVINIQESVWLRFRNNIESH